MNTGTLPPQTLGAEKVSATTVLHEQAHFPPCLTGQALRAFRPSNPSSAPQKRGGQASSCKFLGISYVIFRTANADTRSRTASFTIQNTKYTSCVSASPVAPRRCGRDLAILFSHDSVDARGVHFRLRQCRKNKHKETPPWPRRICCRH